MPGTVDDHRRAAMPLVAALLVPALIFAACSPTAPTSSPSPVASATATPGASETAPPTSDPSADQAVYRDIEDQVIAIRDLQPTSRLVPTIIDGPTLVANLTAEFDRTNKPEDLAKDEALLIALGLLPAGGSLRDAYLDLQGSQVVGYYSPDDKALFVVSRGGGLGPTEKATFAHEFTHALQDQNFDLDSLDIDDPSNGDRSLGRLALVEGDAVATQTEWMLAHLTTEELTQLIADASDAEVLAAFARAPAILRETSLFPYQAGHTFVESLRAVGGFERVNAAFGAAPESTAQILHPGTYPGSGAPLLEDLSGYAEAAGAGWVERREDTLGELITSVWLSENGVREAAAATGSAGWANDRIALFEHPNGDHVVLLFSLWESSADAQEFEDTVRPVLDVEPFAALVRTAVDQVYVVFGTSEAAVDGIRNQLRTVGCC